MRIGCSCLQKCVRLLQWCCLLLLVKSKSSLVKSVNTLQMYRPITTNPQIINLEPLKFKIYMLRANVCNLNFVFQQGLSDIIIHDSFDWFLVTVLYM